MTIIIYYHSILLLGCFFETSWKLVQDFNTHVKYFTFLISFLMAAWSRNNQSPLMSWWRKWCFCSAACLTIPLSVHIPRKTRGYGRRTFNQHVFLLKYSYEEEIIYPGVPGDILGDMAIEIIYLLNMFEWCRDLWFNGDSAKSELEQWIVKYGL